MVKMVSFSCRCAWLIVAIAIGLSVTTSVMAKGRNVKPKPAPAKRPKPANVKPKAPIKMAALPPQLTATIVTLPTGTVVLRNGKRLSIKVGTMLHAGDVVLGAAAGNTDIRIGEQGTVRVKPKSKLNIKTLLRQSKNDPNTIDNRLKLEQGTLLIRLKKLQGQSRFIIDTPSATTAARGTAFIVHANTARTTVLVESGVVALSATGAPVPTKTDQELQVWAWQKATVEKSALPVPQLMTPGDWNQLEELREEPLPPSVRPEPIGEIRRFAGHKTIVRNVAFSPDGKKCASLSDDLTARLWEVETGRELHNLKFDCHPSSSALLKFSPNGEALIYCCYDQVFVWEVATGRQVRRIKIPGIPFGSEIKAISSVEPFLAVSWGNDIRLWDEQRQLFRDFKGHTGPIMSVAISQDDTRLLSGSLDKTMRLWDVATGRELRRFDSDNEVRTVYFSPDGNRAIFYSVIGTPPNEKPYNYRYWDVDNWREIRRVTGGGNGWPVVFSPDGRRVLIADNSYGFLLFDLESGTAPCHFSLAKFGEGTASLAVSPDGTRALFGAHSAGSVRLWSLPTLQSQQSFLEDFERTPVGQPAWGAYAWQATTSQSQVVRDRPGSGGQCLKCTHTEPNIWPVLYYPDFASGTVMSRFDLKLVRGNGFVFQWSEGSRLYIPEILGPEHQGPAFQIDGTGQLTVSGVKRGQIPSGQWVRCEIVSGVGSQANGKFNLTVHIPGRAPLKLTNQIGDPQFKYLKQVNFGTYGELPQTFFLDNVQVQFHQGQ